MSGGITTVIPDFEGAEAVITTGLLKKIGEQLRKEGLTEACVKEMTEA
ncbi:MAG: hypothetical protein J6N53_02430 [Lachnospiraceae bacterium]|nr:hypothetical protein [Lachnospiraceae bacterium]MBP3295051.1 hypothetical protein [Lachnospiraceae bacterium]